MILAQTRQRPWTPDRHRRRRLHRLELRPPGAAAHRRPRRRARQADLRRQSAQPGRRRRRPAFRLRPRATSPTAGWSAAAVSRAPPDLGGELRRRKPRRPLDRRAARLRRDQHRRRLRVARGGARHFAELDAAARARFRFLHVSTDEVYGSLGATGMFTRGDALRAELALRGVEGRRPIISSAPITRPTACRSLMTNCSNNYGPYQFPEKLIPLMILNALEGKPLPIYGDGGNVRDWLYVEDHCEGILQVLERGQMGGKYNIGGAQRAHQPGARRPPVRGARRAGAGGRQPGARHKGLAQYARAQDLRRATARAMTGATRSTRRASACARLAPAARLRVRVARHRGAGIWATAIGARRCRPAATGASGSG